LYKKQHEKPDTAIVNHITNCNSRSWNEKIVKECTIGL
jgi:hypothetical protein